MNFHRLSSILIFFLFFSCPGTQAMAEETRILVKPFTIEADQEYAFLEKGIFKMLLSRLDIPGTCTPVLANDPDASLADYILTGTILIFGDGISTDATLTDPKTGTSALVFNELGKTKGDALAHINLLTQQIKTDLLGIGPKTITPVQPIIQQQPQRQQPEKKAELWRSPAINGKIISLALADITGDSRNETITASKDKITVLAREGKALQKISEFEIPGFLDIISVDAADLNDNKNAEIYITCIDERSKRPASLVMEWKGSGFTTLLEKQPWLFRIIKTKTRGELLLGQRPKAKGKMLETPVSRLNWQANELTATDLKLPKGISLYSFTYGDLLNNGSEMIAALTLNGTIRIFSTDGNEVWRSSKGYGGIASFLEYKGIHYNKDDGYQMSRVFLQQRLFIADLDGDTKNALIVVKNVDSAGGVLKKTRYYSKGAIQSLTWDEMGLAPDGRTRTFPGYLSDYTIGDMNNDGNKELVYCVTRSDGVVDQKHKTRIYSQDRLSTSYNQAF